MEVIKIVNVKKHIIIELLSLVNNIGVEIDTYYRAHKKELLQREFDYEFIDKAIDYIISKLKYHYFVDTHKTEYNLKKDMESANMQERIKTYQKKPNLWIF